MRSYIQAQLAGEYRGDTALQVVTDSTSTLKSRRLKVALLKGTARLAIGRLLVLSLEDQPLVKNRMTVVRQSSLVGSVLLRLMSQMASGKSA